MVLAILLFLVGFIFILFFGPNVGDNIFGSHHSLGYVGLILVLIGIPLLLLAINLNPARTFSKEEQEVFRLLGKARQGIQARVCTKAGSLNNATTIFGETLEHKSIADSLLVTIQKIKSILTDDCESSFAEIMVTENPSIVQAIKILGKPDLIANKHFYTDAGNRELIAYDYGWFELGVSLNNVILLKINFLKFNKQFFGI